MPGPLDKPQVTFVETIEFEFLHTTGVHNHHSKLILVFLLE